ncbi:hypothetical protein [Persephonella sp.]
MSSIILTPQSYNNLQHFSELKITSLENFVNQNLLQKNLHRRKNLKEALQTILKVAFVYRKMGYEEIGISSSTFQNLLICSKQTVFNFISDMKKHFSGIIEIKTKIDSTGRYRNFFKVKEETFTHLTQTLTEEETKQIKELIQEAKADITVEDLLQHIKKEKNLTFNQLRKEIKKMLKKKEQFKAYLRQIAQTKKAEKTKNLSLQEIKAEAEKILKKEITNPEYLQAVHRLMKEGKDLKTACIYASIKYDPVM